MGWHVHLEWVASANNISDQVSRHDSSSMDEIGAHRDSLELQDLFRILARVATDQSYANGRALLDVLSLQLHKHPQPLTGRVGTAAASVAETAQLLEVQTGGSTSTL